MKTLISDSGKTIISDSGMEITVGVDEDTSTIAVHIGDIIGSGYVFYIAPDKSYYLIAIIAEIFISQYQTDDVLLGSNKIGYAEGIINQTIVLAHESINTIFTEAHLLTTDGKTNWYIPDMYEMQAMYDTGIMSLLGIEYTYIPCSTEYSASQAYIFNSIIGGFETKSKHFLEWQQCLACRIVTTPGTSYQYIFKSEIGDVYKILFKNTAGIGTPLTLSPTELGYSLKYQEPTNKTYEPLIATEATFELINDVIAASMIGAIQLADLNSWYVVIYKYVGSEYVRQWQGIVNPETIIIPDSSNDPPVGTLTITANDGYGYLENVKYTPVDEDTQKCTLHWFYLAIQAITQNLVIEDTEQFLMTCSMWYDVSMDYDPETIDPLQEELLFVDDFLTTNEYGTVEGMTYKAILESILSTHNCWMFQQSGRYVVINPNSYINWNVRGFEYYYLDINNSSAKDFNFIWGGLPANNFIPDRFSGGEYSSILKSGIVNSSYAYKSAKYGDSLIPKCLYNPITNNAGMPGTVIDIGTSDISRILHFEGSANFTLAHSGGIHGTQLLFAIGFIIKCGSYYLKNDYSWSLTAPANESEYIRISSAFFYITVPNISLNVTMNMDTLACPTDQEALTIQIRYARTEENGTYMEWTDPTGGHTMDYTCTFADDWKGLIGLDGEMSGTKGYFATVLGNDIKLDLAETNIGDGIKKFNISRIQNAEGNDTTLWFGNNYPDTPLPIHQLRCLEMLAWNRNNVQIFSGYFYGEFNFLQRYFWGGKYWIWFGGTYYANSSRYDGKLIALLLDYNDITVGLLGTKIKGG